MSAWIGGVASAVVIALVTGYLTDWFGIGGAPNRAVARVTSFNQYGNQGGVAPYATITVENEGKKTAENCVVYWKPGMLGNLGFPEQENTSAFALSAGATQTINLRSQVAFRSGIGQITGTAWIACSNTRSPDVQVTAFIL